MRPGCRFPSFVLAFAFALGAGACLPQDPDYFGPGKGGNTGTGGGGGTQSGGGGSAGSTGGSVGAGGSSGSGSGLAGASGQAGTAGSAGIAGSGGTAGRGGATGSAGAGMAGAQGVAGASGGAGTGGAGAAGRGGSGAGGAVAGRGGGPGGAGMAGSGGASGAAGSGSGGSGSAMRSPGCGKAPTLTSGSRTIQSGGQSRSYMLRIPDNYGNSQPYRLIFAYHWNGGTMQDIDGGGTSGAAWSYYGLRAQANNSTIFVAAQGIGNGWAQFRRPRPDAHRRPGQAHRRRSLRGHDEGLRAGFQLRRRHELRARVRAPRGLPGGRGLLGWRAQRVRRRHAARRLPRHSRFGRRNVEHLRRPLDAGQVRHEQRLHPARTRPSRGRAA